MGHRGIVHIDLGYRGIALYRPGVQRHCFIQAWGTEALLYTGMGHRGIVHIDLGYRSIALYRPGYRGIALYRPGVQRHCSIQVWGTEALLFTGLQYRGIALYEPPVQRHCSIQAGSEKHCSIRACSTEALLYTGFASQTLGLSTGISSTLPKTTSNNRTKIKYYTTW